MGDQDTAVVAIFVYAFFKFTWSLRQFNMACVLVGAAPKVPLEAEEESDYIERSWRVSHLAAEHFNYGLRAYYFALAAMTWFLNAWLFMGAATWVAFVLYWREFRSDALRASNGRRRAQVRTKAIPERVATKTVGVSASRTTSRRALLLRQGRIFFTTGLAKGGRAVRRQ